MPRTFAYVRISTVGQTTENQIQEIEAAGFKVDPRRVATVYGSSAIEQRLGFIKLRCRHFAGSRRAWTSAFRWTWT